MKKIAHDCWYMIEEYVPPSEAIANVPVWIPLRIKDGAEATFQSLQPGRKLRLVRIERRTVAEKGP